ncbi:MAG: cysteine rich repeat-containing protein [Pseudomonadota bacterium]
MKKVFLLMTFLFTIGFVQLSMAKDMPCVGKGDCPCSADAEKFCKDVEPGPGAMMKCLKEHDNELSAACKEKCQEMGGKFKNAKKACKADRESFCKDVKPGRGNMAKCLKEHDSELSEECKSSFPHHQK